MRLDLGPRLTAVGAWVAIAARGLRGLGRLPPMPSQIAAAVFAAVLVAGCEPMPTPETALLKPQPPPRCDAKSKSGSKATGSDADLSRLEYEAQCYRHAEMIVRNRLSKLQKQVRGVASTSTSKAATATE